MAFLKCKTRSENEHRTMQLDGPATRSFPVKFALITCVPSVSNGCDGISAVAEFMVSMSAWLGCVPSALCDVINTMAEFMVSISAWLG
jgi:hypothetical protein